LRLHAFLDAKGSNQSLPELRDTFETFALRKGHRVSAFYNEQDFPAARSSLIRLLRDKGLAIASPGRRETQPRLDAIDELFRLVKQARPGDVLLIQRIGLFGSLSHKQWQSFRQQVRNRKIRIVSMDVEASWMMVSSESAMAPLAKQLTATIMDMVDALGASEKQHHRARQREGIARAKSRGRYKGRPIDQGKHQRIRALLDEGFSWSDVCTRTGASRSTIARVVKSDGHDPAS
jgi:DNA invertase Pin-like site-specific DNA recombinase